MSNDSLKEIDGLLDQLEAKIEAQRTPALLGITLKMTTTVCHKVDYSDLAVWAAEQLGIRNLEFGDTPNDTDYDFDAVSRHSSRFWDQAAIDATVDAAKANLYLPMHEVGNLLSYFADAGLLPEGNYIVNVSW